MMWPQEMKHQLRAGRVAAVAGQHFGISKMPRYRPDIDGLRAIAVLSVVCYHYAPGFITGGFVGVDVFFVISGFLITRLIYDAVLSQSFSFRDFYLRRVRRLFPSLLFTLVLCVVFALLLFSPQDLVRFGGALLSAVLSVSNFYFWRESGYFDASADIKPLLHTWSLSVEEQFYVLWPIVLFLLLTKGPRWLAPSFLMVTGIVSFIIADRWIDYDASAAFYLAPFRVGEFAFGGILVWLIKYQPRQGVILEFVFVAGLALIAYAVLSFTNNTPFPGSAAVVPCLGAALVIYSGAARFSTRLLTNSLAVGIGLISYSLYLIHWPVYVFSRYYADLAGATELGLILLSVAAAIPMYFFVERPFRYPRLENSRFTGRMAGYFASLSAVALGGFALYTSDGWAWRLTDGRRDLMAAVGNIQQIIELRPQLALELNELPFTAAQSNVLVVGDSHSVDFGNALRFSALSRFATVSRIRLDTRCFYWLAESPSQLSASISDPDCRDLVSQYRIESRVISADWVMLAPRWTSESLPHLSTYLSTISEELRSKIVVVGRTAEFSDVPKLMFRHGSREGIEELMWNARDSQLDELNQHIEMLAREQDVLYVDRAELICSATSKRCDAFNDDGRILVWDYGHWTVEGAEWYGNKMAASGTLDFILNDL